MLSFALANWRALPPQPSRLEDFDSKILAGEWAKRLFIKAKRDKGITVDDLQLALPFFKEALTFHQLVIPNSESLPDCVEAVLMQSDLNFTGCGYARFPGETRVRPSSSLSLTDGLAAAEALTVLVARGALTEAKAQAQAGWFSAPVASSQLRESTWWRDELLRRGDHRNVAPLLLDMANSNIELGHPAEAEQNILDAIREAESIDDKQEAIGLRGALVALYAGTEQWSKVQETTARLLAMFEANSFGKFGSVPTSNFTYLSPTLSTPRRSSSGSRPAASV